MKEKRGFGFRLQSAMEYLMTYGWAILIIAVVLAVLFSLGIFGGANLLGTSCVASPGYSCTSALLNRSGYLSFTFGQNTGSELYNIQMACAATTTSGGLPYDTATNGAGVNANFANPFETIVAESSGSDNALATGAAPVDVPAASANALNLANGQTALIANIICYNANGGTMTTNNALGTSFSGTLYINYTTGSGSESASSNPWQTAKMGTITIKVT